MASIILLWKLINIQYIQPDFAAVSLFVWSVKHLESYRKLDQLLQGALNYIQYPPEVLYHSFATCSYPLP